MENYQKRSHFGLRRDIHENGAVVESENPSRKFQGRNPSKKFQGRNPISLFVFVVPCVILF